MDNSPDLEHKNLINDLTQGRELAKLLQIHLNATSSSQETREMLVENILRSYDQALSMLRLIGSEGEPRPTGAATGMSESPLPFGGRPHSEDSDQDFKDHENKDASRKRKTMPRWTKQVQVCSGTGLGRLDDGCSWRKYGQKDILGAKYQRGYYKCRHRNVQGCLATKQVQRSDEDPTIFEITYRGSHTCTQGSHLNPPPSASPEKQEPNTAFDRQQLINQPQQNQQESKEIVLNFQTGLKVGTTEELDTRHQSIPSFFFPSTSHVNAENYVHSPSSMLDNNFARNFSPSFMSPATSGSNYFPVSPAHMTSFGGNQTLHAPESELMEIVSAATSATTSSTVGLDLPFGAVDQFEPTFSFDNPGFFSKFPYHF